MALNTTGHPERVFPSGQQPPVIIQMSAGPSGFDQFLYAWMRKAVHVVGGGDVQVAFGSS